MENDVTLLHEKIDLLTQQVAALTNQVERQNQRQVELENSGAILCRSPIT